MKDLFKPSLDRMSVRLPYSDYSQAGLYFDTIVSQKRACLFGSINDGEMSLNEPARMVDEVCRELPVFIQNMDWVIYQIMPNHFHAIIELKNVGADRLISPVGATLRGCPAQRVLREADNAPIRGAKAGLPLRKVWMLLRAGESIWAMWWGDLNLLLHAVTSMVFANLTGEASKANSGSGIIMNTSSVMKKTIKPLLTILFVIPKIGRRMSNILHR